MLDFTSALYLGMCHPPGTLSPWQSLSTGRPAALYEPPLARSLAAALAKLVGLEQASLGSSSLHLFWDLFGQLPGRDWAVFIDAEAYPIAHWGAERAAGRGLRVQRFPHHDPLALERLLHRSRSRRPLVVTDGYCPVCGKVAPLPAYLAALRRHGGLLLLDDTQALGILGARPGPRSPYGRGGGGSLHHANVAGADIVLIASLAKGFGVPVAVLAGSRHNLRVFERRSEVRVHSSPPSNVALLAARRALYLNQHLGEHLRLRLVSLVGHLRRRLGELGFSAGGGLFPVQNLAAVEGLDAATLHRRLRSHGVRAVLQQGHGATSRLGFLVSVRHTRTDLERLVEILDYLTRGRSMSPLDEEVEHVPQPRAGMGALGLRTQPA